MKIMVRIIKKILNFFLNILYSFKWIIKQALSENFKNYIRKEPKDTIVILANGPSLKKDMEKIRKFNIVFPQYCTLNYFATDKNFFFEVKPAYYVMADPVLLSPKYINEKGKALFDILNKIDWKMNLLIPFSYYKSFIKNNYICNKRNIKITPYHTNIYLGFKNIEFYLYKKGLSMPRVQNVLIACIFNSINFGYKHIILCGTGHSWLRDLEVNYDNKVCLKDKHFYDKNNIELRPWLKTTGENYLMHEILRDLAFMFEGYHKLKEYAFINKVDIDNYTDNSFIDAFPKKI